jgi:predicted dehydrogenase
MAQTRYALVGCGHRARTYLEAIAGPFFETSCIVGLCDTNPGRAALARSRVAHRFPDAACYGAGDFDRMIAEQRPDTVLVMVPDLLHESYICRSLENGCDVIVEKPMAIAGASCARIVETERRTSRAVTVTMNYRFSPVRVLLKEVLDSGIVGDITSVQFQWRLDTHHGADYFRRWHRRMDNAGSLFVHKASHHFDLINWWLGDLPKTVRATGSLQFYRPETADALGLVNRGERCTGCPELARCGVRLDLSSRDYLRSVYSAHEHHDGYFRDRCVFSPDIDIPDTMNALIEYEGGAAVNYSLNAYSPMEGYRAEFEGTRGRIIHTNVERAWVNPDGSLPPADDERNDIVVQRLFDKPLRLQVPTGKGLHSGGDKLMLERLFGADTAISDPYRRTADTSAGAYSIAVGVAANQSIANGAPVDVADVLGPFARPDYAVRRGAPDLRREAAAGYPFLRGASVVDDGII